ncbi:hypothetical protein EYF80_000193 [Liparis tanakae]|uniref:Uncharacterized protein n=1 Tax=Liparis tanakae TaxID=230148 RepID=A0A4Z2JHD6_9TELE|nr:hypothetical protein EYF80_000193 [Liparis tanakae]
MARTPPLASKLQAVGTHVNMEGAALSAVTAAGEQCRAAAVSWPLGEPTPPSIHLSAPILQSSPVYSMC